jgi:hypothetical protein
VALKIKFSHQYPKLHRQTSGKLIAVELRNRLDLHPKFVLYDTHYIDEYKTDCGVDGYCPLPNGLCLVLYFIGEYGIPFCTVRQATGQREAKYRTNIGKVFDVVVETEPAPGVVQTNLLNGGRGVDTPGNTSGGNAGEAGTASGVAPMGQPAEEQPPQ